MPENRRAILAANSRVDDDPGTRAQVFQQTDEMVSPERNAPGGRCIAWPRNMHEHRASPALHTRPRVVVEDQNHIVQSIRPPHVLRTCRIGMFHFAVVVPVADSITPALGRTNGRKREAGLWTAQMILTIIAPADRKLADWCRPITFALID